MKRIIAVMCIAASLTGCAAVGANLASVGDSICAHEEQVRSGLNAAMIGAYVIQDPVRQQLVVAGLNKSLQALDACPERQ